MFLAEQTQVAAVRRENIMRAVALHPSVFHLFFLPPGVTCAFCCLRFWAFFAGSGSTFPPLAPGFLYVSLLWRHCEALETGVTAARSQQDDWDN